ncbi:MAG: hypothetical protein RMJ56_01055 [Gemmataceae bacterium]|nr:hypothetical protein [Gemmata sp.]MDW8196170.1 hypothetical protein [Gemmataceae bacterium]
MRTPQPLKPVEHSMARAGYPLSVNRLAAPSVMRNELGGYVGGGSLKKNDWLARGPMSATGPLQAGTYGTDFGGFRQRLSRVFLAPSNDPSRGYPISWNYRAEGPRLTDIGTLRPFRKAVLEWRDDAAQRHHGGDGHPTDSLHPRPAP